jgi:hypothetical protein
VADDDEKRSYPKIPAKNWWDLRRRLAQSFPKKVDADYLQSVLGLSSKASAQNLIAPLRTLGLIDDDLRPTDRANEWRSDDAYAKVCGEMLYEVYPSGLTDAFAAPTPDIGGVRAWFQRNLRVGDAAAAGMASMYALIAEGDPGAERAPKATTNGSIKTKDKGAKRSTAAVATVRQPSETTPRDGGGVLPSVHIDVQVHLPADATPQLIDQVFESMAKHLYGRS